MKTRMKNRNPLRPTRNSGGLTTIPKSIIKCLLYGHGGYSGSADLLLFGSQEIGEGFLYGHLPARLYGAGSNRLGALGKNPTLISCFDVAAFARKRAGHYS